MLLLLFVQFGTLSIGRLVMTIIFLLIGIVVINDGENFGSARSITILVVEQVPQWNECVGRAYLLVGVRSKSGVGVEEGYEVLPGMCRDGGPSKEFVGETMGMEPIRVRCRMMMICGGGLVPFSFQDILELEVFPDGECLERDCPLEV